jgi:hypothetical protein
VQAGESPAQAVDHAVDGAAILLFGERHALEDACAVDVALGLRGRDRLPVFVDPLIDETAALVEQPQEVVGLQMVGTTGLVRCGSNAPTVAARPVATI